MNMVCKNIEVEKNIEIIHFNPWFFRDQESLLLDFFKSFELGISNKDVVEKAFGNLKERLNMRRTLVSSEQSLDGKLFVEFIALIYLSYIKKQMQDHDLFKSYTLQGVLDKLDVIECFESPGRGLRIGELLEKQKDLYIKLGVTLPTSL